MPTSITSLRPARSASLPNTTVVAVCDQQERREHPAIERQAAKLADDLRHGGRDDGRFDGDHEIGRHDGDEHKRTVSREGIICDSWEVARHFNGQIAVSPNRVRVMRAFSRAVWRAAGQAERNAAQKSAYTETCAFRPSPIP